MKRTIICLAIVTTFIISGGISLRGGAFAQTAAPVTADSKWEQRWNDIVSAAKKEGAVLIYFAPNPTVQKNLAEAFKQKYGIDLQFVTGRGAALAEKISSERRAGLYLGDVIIQGYTAQFIFKPQGVLQPLSPLLILPEVMEPKNWIDGNMTFIDSERTIASFINSVENPVMRNNQAVRDGEIKSYYDLLAPKWKGQIVMGDPTIEGMSQSWFCLMLEKILGAEKGTEYMKQLVKQEPVITRDDRLGIEGVARAKYLLAIGLHPPTVAEFRALGAPVEPVRMVEGTPTTASMGNISVLDKPAHPNATIVFLNWILSKEGQTVFSQSLKMPSARVDVPTTGMDPYYVRQPGEKIFSNYEAELVELKGKLAPKAKEIFDPLLK
jgi:iron(III) transport system substrate-binding protein